jgi:hypothetical protein
MGLLVSLYHFVMPHKSLRQGCPQRTPVMALGLTDHGWSYREYIWLPVHTAPGLTTQRDERMARRLTPALQAQPLGRTQAPPPGEVIQEHEKETPPLPKAAAGARYYSPGLPEIAIIRIVCPYLPVMTS